MKLKVLNGNYFLSPELAESYFVLWRLTRERKYQEYAWEMAKAIYRYCQTGSGFAGLEDVNNITSIWIDHQPPIFLSATLKYIYLTFSSESVLPLDQWVFNSVGHPLPICGRQNTYPAQLCITNV
ncbi:Mannosyl-oligosaccharide 1,2-alpha-mannosidase IB [Tyrophagus putrescentiae]|nr:Mannosyl-oligosaccharide 1,2-alpha-mannosidase IB [Tyrophagus putrescentiae]